MMRILKKTQGVSYCASYPFCLHLVSIECIPGYKANREKICSTRREYISGTGNIKGDVDIEKWEALGEEFAIGANKDGYAVFKNPRKAMNAICSDFKAGIRAMQKEGAPMGFRSNYSSYIDYELAVSGDAETNRQANIVAGFVDIYENSFVPIEPE